MEIGEVKAALGKLVRFRNDRLFCDADYILTGCIIRRSERGQFYYQAEIQDLQNQTSVSIVNLSDLTREEKTDESI